MKRLALTLTATWLCVSAMLSQTCWQNVDPRIGSVGVGRTFPGPSMPFGMVKPGPDCGVLPNAGWAPMPESVLGFSQTHVSGTGGGQKYGNVLIQPYLEASSAGGRVPFQQGKAWRMIPQRRVIETIALGYYATTFDNGIRTEITTSERCSFYRIQYPEAGSLFVDVTHFLGKDTVPNLRERQQFVGCDFKVISDHEVNGYSSVRGGWNNGDAYTVFFTLVTDVPFTADSTCLHFRNKVVNVKIGISYVSTEQARRNIPDHDFDTQLSLLRNTWEQQLSKIQIDGTDEQRRMFYTALYHTMLIPVDKTGEYPHEAFSAISPDVYKKVAGGDASYYDDYYAIWDTYRTSSPLLTLLCPDRQTAIVNALLNIYELEGYMPDARSGDCNGRTQGGSNAEVVIADAFAKGLEGIDYQFALEAMLKDATTPPADDEKEGRGGLAEYNRLGYIPYGIDRAGNRTVEYAFNDWCIAQVARGLGQKAIYKEYMEKSRNWRNLWRGDYEWDGMRGFILPKDDKGHWMDSVPWGKSKVFHPTIPYTPVTKVAPWYLPWWSTFFYEATSEEYSLSIPHDVPGLIRACGGKKAFKQRLDLFFEKGYYNVANEPSFLTPCLYHWIGRPELSSQRVHQIIRDHYTDRFDGLPGNDDSGAMSSWLAFHMMGLYPNAGTDDYLLNLPLLQNYTFSLANGRTLHVSKTGNGDQLHSVLLNGRKLKHARITHQQLMQGGELVFKVSPNVSLQGSPKKTEHHSATQSTPSLNVKHSSISPSHSLLDENSGEISFILNRQFRTWPLTYGWDADTLVLTCKQTTYRIPRSVVDHASSFCWLSPQTDGTNYNNVAGTVAFISRDALHDLQSSGAFLYDNITWRLIDKSDNIYHVRADIDDTEMWIAASTTLPFVLEMRNNPLGIDWKLTTKNTLKSKAQHVLVIGIDGWGGYSLAKAHDIPNIRMLMQQGCYTAKKRSVLPSDSGVNWASMFNGSCPELHGYTTWNSHTPEIPSVELNEHGKFPTIFSILRKARPDVVTGCIAEWDGIKHVVDTLAIDNYDLAPDWEHHTSLLCEMAERFIIDRKPTLFAVCWDQLDHTGHSIGHDTPEYYQTLADIDVYIGRLVQALKTAGIYDQTVIILTADHGGVGKGHGGKSLLEMEHPFIICGRGIRSGQMIHEPMMQFDTAATIAYILGLTPPQSWVGRPVLSVFTK